LPLIQKGKNVTHQIAGSICNAGNSCNAKKRTARIVDERTVEHAKFSQPECSKPAASNSIASAVWCGNGSEGQARMQFVWMATLVRQRNSTSRASGANTFLTLHDESNATTCASSKPAQNSLETERAGSRKERCRCKAIAKPQGISFRLEDFPARDVSLAFASAKRISGRAGALRCSRHWQRPNAARIKNAAPIVKDVGIILCARFARRPLRRL
jgi:hypothetical protein